MIDEITVYGIPTGTYNPYPEGLMCGGHEGTAPKDDPADPDHWLDRDDGGEGKWYHVSRDATNPPCDSWAWALG